MASSFFSSDHCVDSSVSTITHKRNSGRKKFKETRHPIYRGVRERKGSKWVCEMRLNNSNIIKSRLWLGTHISPEMAARAYDIAALALKGKSAQLNFPDSAWLLIRAKSTSATDILSAALLAAQAFRPIAKSVGTSTCVSSLKTVIEIPAALEVVNAFCSTDNSSSTSTCIVLPCVETLEIFVESSPALFLDEEAMFNMPCLLANMAEGMLLSPPESIWDYMYTPSNTDLSLWSV